jgi:hypothetical protein
MFEVLKALARVPTSPTSDNMLYYNDSRYHFGNGNKFTIRELTENLVKQKASEDAQMGTVAPAQKDISSPPNTLPTSA